MNRPRLPFVKEYFQDIANRGNEEAQNLMTEYQEIIEHQGEFLAGRFIIEVRKEFTVYFKKDGILYRKTTIRDFMMNSDYIDSTHVISLGKIDA